MLTSQQITCKTFYTAIDAVVSVGVNAIPVLGPAKAAGVTIAVQAAEVMAWAFSERNEAREHYNDWLRDPSGSGSEPPEEIEPSTGLMDTICGNKHTDDAAEAIFTTFQTVASYASAPRFFAGAARRWPPPFTQGNRNVDDARDFINNILRKGKDDGDKGKSEPTKPDTEPTQPKPKSTPTPAPTPTPTPTPTPSARSQARRRAAAGERLGRGEPQGGAGGDANAAPARSREPCLVRPT